MNSFIKEDFLSNVSHPAHYNTGKIEVIEFIEDKGLGFHLGNAVKYIARAGKKDPTKHQEDLEKAKWYLEREIETKFAMDVRRPNDMRPEPKMVELSKPAPTFEKTMTEEWSHANLVTLLNVVKKRERSHQMLFFQGLLNHLITETGFEEIDDLLEWFEKNIKENSHFKAYEADKERKEKEAEEAEILARRQSVTDVPLEERPMKKHKKEWKPKQENFTPGAFDYSTGESLE